MTTNTYPCFLGHNYIKEKDTEMLTDINNITHVVVKCKRCGDIQILHLDNKKAL